MTSVEISDCTEKLLCAGDESRRVLDVLVSDDWSGRQPRHTLQRRYGRECVLPLIKLAYEALQASWSCGRDKFSKGNCLVDGADGLNHM